MKFRVFVIAIFMCAGLTGLAIASDNTGVEARVIGSTFKTMAKAYLAVANMDHLKTQNINRIRSMHDYWFARKYAEVYPVIRKMPPALQQKYHVSERMTIEQAVAIIQSMDKPKLYEIIDNVPNAVIAEEFNRYFEQDEAGKGGHLGLSQRIQQTWAGIVAKANQGADMSYRKKEGKGSSGAAAD